MAALIAPGICRYTINGTFNGRTVANIVDMQVDTTGSFEDRDDAIFTIAGDIINNWSDHVLPSLSNQYTAQSVSWVDLDEADGFTGSRTSTDGTTFPEAGGSAGDCMPGNVAFRINKVGSARRGQRAGRMYLPGVNEAANQGGNGNLLASGVVSDLTDSMEDFRNGIEDTLNDIQRVMVVLHVVDGVYQGFSGVTALQCDPTFGSQRRRLRS